MTTIFPAWHFGRWHAVDDRVRGGSSQSHLDAVPLHGSYQKMEAQRDGSGQKEESSGGKRCAARFWGTLDTKTLGGAGFASRKYQFGPESLSLPRARYRGVILRIIPAHSHGGTFTRDADETRTSNRPETFTLVFKTQLNARPPSKPKLPPSPDPASLSYEAQFVSTATSTPTSTSLGAPISHSLSRLFSFFGTDTYTAAPSTSHAHTKEIKIPFDDFIPTYRGRPVPPSDPKYKPFDPASIYEVSLMCRSDFGKQEGEFELVVESISGWENEGQGSMKARDGCWGWVSGMLGWREEGKIRLDEAEIEKR